MQQLMVCCQGFVKGLRYSSILPIPSVVEIVQRLTITFRVQYVCYKGYGA